MGHERRTRVAAIVGALALALACGDADGVDPVAPTWSLPTSFAEGAWSATEPPICDGLPATIWAGMDPSLVPAHALVKRMEEDDSDHDDEQVGKEQLHPQPTRGNKASHQRTRLNR